LNHRRYTNRCFRYWQPC